MPWPLPSSLTLHFPSGLYSTACALGNDYDFYRGARDSVLEISLSVFSVLESPGDRVQMQTPMLTWQVPGGI
jgi:hypothetical protein